MAFGEMEDNGCSKRLLVIKKQWQLLFELCHFTQDLNPSWQAKTIQRQLKKFMEPLLQEVEAIESEEQRFHKINQLFFETLNFKITSAKKIQLTNAFLPNVLIAQKGPAPILMLVYCALLEECNIRVQVTSSRLKYLLKVQINNNSHMIDFAKKGKLLKPTEIVDLINRGFDFSSGCLDANTLVIEYLNLIKKLSRKENKLQILSMTHSYLMKYQPFNLKHISERAIVAYETGDYRRAVEDIRNYFQYKQVNFTNQKLKKIYKIAVRKQQNLNP